MVQDLNVFLSSAVFTMYLALRWLIGLSFAMWMALCCIDFYNERNKEIFYKGFKASLLKSENISDFVKRHTIDVNRMKSNNADKYQNTTMLHYGMFIAGAIAVSIFNRKKDIILYTKSKIIHINICAMKVFKKIEFKKAAFNISVAVMKYITLIWEYWLKSIQNYLSRRKALQSHYKIHLQLLNKIREFGEERKNLGQLLVSVIRENKTIRMQYQMEIMAKNRLLQHIEDTQRQIKENRSKYISFQNLYLVTHQENIFLKARLKKVSQEKEEAEKNLISLVNEIYQSTNIELKAYCSRFMVRTRENLLSRDVNAEIQKFLERSPPATSYQGSSDYVNLEASPRIAEPEQSDVTLVPIISNAPKLKGLPGECIWTVKDKDGIIEKLYEYDFAEDFNKGDTIRRIREYSVYHDKDCLLDFTNSNTALFGLRTANITIQQQQCVKVDFPLTSHRFLTGSQAFQKFLRDNQHFIHLPTSDTRAMICE